MAEPEHLKILNQGVEAWNKWRKEHPDIKPILRKANQKRLDLPGAHHSRVNLSSADLSEADLSNAALALTNIKSIDMRNVKGL